MKGISFLLACSPVIFGEKLPKDAPERVEIRFIPGYKRGEEPDRHSRHKRETNHQSGNTILDDYGFFYGESCGDKPTAQYRMMGGEEANIEEYPWQLYLTLGAENLNGPFSYKCGATVISNWYALTSAGCICPRGVKIPGLYSATCMKPELSGMINSMSTITCKTMRSDPNNATAPSDTEDYGQYSFNDEPHYYTNWYPNYDLLENKRDNDQPACHVPADKWSWIDSFTVHPDFKRIDDDQLILGAVGNMINNIAVVKRHQNPFQFSDYLYPACLPKAETCLGFGTQVTVTGYGMFDRSYSHGFGGQVKIQSYDYGDFIRYTNQLKKATMSITKKSTCKWTSDNSHWYDYEYGLYNSLQFDSNNDGTDGHICAKGFIDAKSNNVANAGEVCGGDQGGPMTYFDNNGVATVVGVVSHGDCGDFGNDGLYEVNYDYDGHVQPHLMTPSVYTDVSYYLEFINQNTNLDLTAYGDLTGTNCKSDTHTSNFGFASNSQQNNDPSTKISDSHRLIKLNDPIGPIIEYKVLNHSVRYDEFMYGWCIAATQTTVNDWIFDANDPNSITNSIYNYLSNTAVDKTDTYKRQRGFYKANDFTRDNNIRHPFQIIPRICKQGSPFTEWAYDAATKQIYSVMTKLPKRKNGAYKLHSAWCWTYGNHQQGIFVLPCRENDLKQKFEIETVKKVNHLSSTASFAQGTNVEYHEMITNHPALNNVKHIYTVNPRRVLQFKKLRPVQFLKSPNFKSKTNTYFHINTDFDYLKTLIPTGTAAGEIFSISPIEAIGNSWNTGCIAPTKYLAGKFVRIMPQSTSVSSKCKFGMYKLHDSSFSDDAIMIKVVNEQNNDNLCFKIRYDVSRNLKQTALKLAVCNEADRYQQFSRRQWNMQGGNLKQLCIAEKEHFCLIFTRTMTLNLNTRQTHGLEVVEGLQTKNRGNQLVQSQYWCNTHSSSGIDCQAIPSTAGRYCPGMWTGDNCDIEPVTCKPWQKLLDNGICRDYECICRTSRGYAIDWENDSYATKSLCNRDSRICRSCKNGWTGEECISNTCDLDLRNWSSSTAVCGSCKNGMYGPNCDENCDNNGVYDAGTDSCTCSGYWTGDRCDVSTQSCSGSQFTGNYNSDGSCSCTGYWTGLNCDVTSLDCSHRTTQFDGTCVGQCDTGYHESETAPYNCVPNVCECTYGEGAQGTNCSVPGTNKCGVCNYGYHLNTVTYTCDLNQCTCAGYWWSNSYDFSTEGTYCPVNGATGCYQCEFTHNLGPEIIATPTNYVEIINSNTPVLDYNNTVINNFRLHEKFRLQMKLKFAYDYDLPNGQKRPLSDYLEQVRSFGLISFYHPNITATPFAREFDIVGYFDNVLCQPICQPTDSVSFYVTWTIRDAAAEIQTADSRYMIMHTVTPGQWYDFTFEYSPRRRAIYVDHKKVFDTTDIDYYENTPPSEFWQQYHPNDLPGATSVYPTFGYDGTLVLAYAKGGDSTGYGNDNNMNYYQINKAPITFGSVTYQELTQEPNPTCHDMNYRECICPNGTPIDPALCPSDGANYCSKCDQGYKYNEATHTCDYENCGYGHYWRDVDETCQENWCVCTEHPTEQYASASGQGCKVDGGYGCNYCPANYTKGYDRNLTASNSLDIISTPYLLDMPDPCSPNCAPGVILNNIHFYEKFRFSMRLKFNSLPSETGMSATYFKLASFINPEVTTANILNHDQDDREFELDGWQDLELNGDISLTIRVNFRDASESFVKWAGVDIINPVLDHWYEYVLEFDGYQFYIYIDNILKRHNLYSMHDPYDANGKPLFPAFSQSYVGHFILGHNSNTPPPSMVIEYIKVEEITKYDEPAVHCNSDNTCTCDNGTVASSSLCENDGDIYCVACNSGYQYNYATKDCDLI